MPPVWDQNEARASVYHDVQKHSEGMISFTYRPPSKADLDALKNTETYRSLIRERGEESLVTPTELPKILLVEDDLDIQKVVRMSLKSRGGGEVVVANSGEECLAAVNQVKPDVILLDVMMPTLDGYETCRRLKANPETRSIPVIFLTANAQQFEVKRGLEAGSRGYLIKPFDPMTLQDQIVALLDQAGDPDDIQTGPHDESTNEH